MPDGVNPDPIPRDSIASLRAGGQAFGGRRLAVRIALLVALAAFVSGCGGDKPEVVAGQTLSGEALKQKCADPQWRDQNLGIWYAVCRQSVTW